MTMLMLMMKGYVHVVRTHSYPWLLPCCKSHITNGTTNMRTKENDYENDL